MTHQAQLFQTLQISKKRFINGIALFWGIVILFLVLADIFLNHYELIDSIPLRRLVNITRDDGLANWFSSIQLLFVSVVLWMVLFVLVYSKPNLIIKKREKIGWSLSALFFSYLAVDDGSKMHERVGTAFSNSIEARHAYNPSFISNLFDVFPSYGWQFVFIPFFGLIAIFMLLFFIKNLKTKTQIIFILLGFFCYGSSVIIDFAEGMDVKVYNSIISFLNTDLYSVEHFSRVIEETFEMVGNTFFMLAFTIQLINLSNYFKIKFVDSFKNESIVSSKK